MLREKCAVCDQRVHDEPKAFLRLYNVTCPGDQASEEQKKAFADELAWRKLVNQRFGQQVASDPELTNTLMKRREAALDRAHNPVTRVVPTEAVVSQAQVESVDATTTAMTGKQEIAEVLAEPAEFEIEVPHLTVPGDVPVDKTPLVPRHSRQGTKHQSSDYLLYMGDEPE